MSFDRWEGKVVLDSRMKKLISDLSKFSQSHSEIEDVLIDLKQMNDSSIETLRIKLTKLLSKTNSDDKVVDGLFLSDAIYAILLVLAELKPLNNDDIISGEPINKKNSIFIASGQQFDITQLIKYHHSRLPRKNETEHEKQLLNPLTNEAFSLQDREHIQAIAKERSIPIRDLKVDEIWRNNNLGCVLN